MRSLVGWGGLRATAGVGAMLALVLLISLTAEPVSGLKKRISIPDDLSDVVDDEEDEEWQDWGRRKKKEPEVEQEAPFEIGNGPIDVKKLMNQQAKGPQLTFARLRPDPTRTKEEVDEIGAKWSALLRTGGMSDQVYAIDEGTILISIVDGIYMDEIKEFVLSMDEAYEFEWKNQKFRRPGDPPLEVPKSPEKSKPSKKKAKKSKKNKASKSDEKEL
uniref:Mesoderm development candidate 2 n=1 Tax=Pyramimonas obovata TaxID=1411642 RepID=A0A7S0N8F7_9CHLO|mmetsp:Transcript_22791/g.49965  ORF Transcript_22791/g.49965 Transcript_22791/m.49965 type:complete len:217 (+) Transcript_22791:117-767(+)|eukprot:CAMPEP_0118924416 /NCGR_PEP_ID=MMETSP1169-20130426/2564_1 /TAXON_ID=36882 /ORGANISM="Pyramimonas obovata, Strain CCMP722" /LENGTH=216 /DNA_ID=CAMNT_0006865529 /DNA_START=108 /DNA_END=758 /DNA_ORIENTATION=+